MSYHGNIYLNWCHALNLLQNGYPSRRRSLVDDARFESSCVKQTKQAVLEEARLKANGEFDMSFENLNFYAWTAM